MAAIATYGRISSIQNVEFTFLRCSKDYSYVFCFSLERIRIIVEFFKFVGTGLLSGKVSFNSLLRYKSGCRLYCG